MRIINPYGESFRITNPKERNNLYLSPYNNPIMQQRYYFIYAILLIVTLLLSHTWAMGQAISRIGNSPYPATATPDTLYMIHTERDGRVDSRVTWVAENVS